MHGVVLRFFRAPLPPPTFPAIACPPSATLTCWTVNRAVSLSAASVARRRDCSGHGSPPSSPPNRCRQIAAIVSRAIRPRAAISFFKASARMSSPRASRHSYCQWEPRQRPHASDTRSPPGLPALDTATRSASISRGISTPGA